MGMDISDVHECIGNPLKLRILMLLARNGPMTAKTILQETGASQTTVYRALGGMQEAGIIRVVSETKVRAVIERTYDISFDFEHFDVDMVRDNDLKGYCSMFGTFMLGLMRDFEEYSEDPDADLNRDSTGFASTGVYLTEEQARKLSWDMVSLMEPYLARTSDDQRLHTLAFVLTPPQRRESVAENRIGTIPIGPEGAGE